MTTAQKVKNIQKGFTLIELMIAIAIVAILATVGFTVFSNTQINARDAKRRQDIDAIATAIEGKKVPGLVTYGPVTGADFSGGAVPTDPKAGAATGKRIYCLITFAQPVPPTIAPGILTAANLPNQANAALNCTTSGVTPANTFATMATNIPATASNITAWAVCALLEQGNQLYCKKS